MASERKQEPTRTYWIYLPENYPFGLWRITTWRTVPMLGAEAGQ